MQQQINDPQKDCHALISLSYLTHNLKCIQKKAGKAKVIAMVKGNAYGHGLEIVTKHLFKEGVKHFGIATVKEGIQVRKLVPKANVIIMGGSGFTSFLDEVYKNKLTPSISSLEELLDLTSFLKTKALKKPYAFHLDLDTGMNRAGLKAEKKNFKTLLQVTKHLKKHSTAVKMEALSTHLANSEEDNCNFSKKQITLFCKSVELLLNEGFKDFAVHFEKSAAIFTDTRAFNKKQLKHLAGLNLFVRPGISLYGIDSTANNQVLNLKPVLTLKAPITLRKRVKKGEKVGYNNTWTAKKDTEIAIVRAGYGDGFPWQLSGIGKVIINKKSIPVRGRISMDTIIVDVTSLSKKNCSVGQLVTLIANKKNSPASVTNIAHSCRTIIYEILMNISPRVKRIPE